MAKNNNPGCNCCCNCAVTVTFKDCKAGPNVGVAYAIYDPDGNVVTSGTTGVSGQATFTATKAGQYKYDSSKSRYATATNANLVNLTSPCPSTQSVNVAAVAGSGYVCTVLCGDPIADTIHVTDYVYGAVTCVWTGASWEGSKSISYSACGTPSPPCGADTITAKWTVTPSSSNITVSVTYPTVGGGPPTNTCPQAGGTNFIGTVGVDTAPTCPPTFSFATPSSVCVAGYCLRFYCGSNFGASGTE